ncbi:MAG: hypothetical protein FJ197_08840 [Gammaproteobacteria bacterium]|nr:hypothetical protein [Gammaproteobacteria bacterium]
MHPFTVVLGVVAGSLLSLASGLGIVLAVFWLLRDEHPRFAFELPELMRATAMFTVLSVFASAGFVGQVRARRWRFAPQGLLWAGLVAVGWYYWPS